MSDNLQQNQSVQSTMLLPLWGRAKYSSRNPDILNDLEAKRIVKQCGLDFSFVEKGFGEFSGICYITRAREIDDKIRHYLVKHPKATIVNIGAGLDTTFSRVDNGEIYWYNLDLPDAIHYRNRFIKNDFSRSSNIASSFLDPSWFDEIRFEPRDGILFVSGGAFHYFHEQQLRRILCAMSEYFTGGELYFDIMTKKAMQRANQMVKNTGNKSAMMHFCVNDANLFEQWSSNIKVISHEPLFKNIVIKKKWRLLTKITCRLFKNSQMMVFINLKFR